MPSKVVVLNIIGIVLQYAVVALLYYFLFKVLRVVYRDLTAERAAERPQVAAAVEQPVAEAARLVVVDAGTVPMSRSEFELGETVSIGRGEENDVVVADSFVSHEHALITRYKHGFWLTDLKSTNGTLHNNRRVADEILLRNGDLIAVGAVTFRFER
ncbi:MAG TPA: FHA domain-containing protein [Negativicutes bacterium]|nr:FHA domain-containing protein [Negativicutes bacterium]